MRLKVSTGLLRCREAPSRPRQRLALTIAAQQRERQWCSAAILPEDTTLNVHTAKRPLADEYKINTRRRSILAAESAAELCLRPPSPPDHQSLRQWLQLIEESAA